MDYATIARAHERWIDLPGFPLERDFSNEEYELRLTRARQAMARHDLDALVITTSLIGGWFTSSLEPHEWHDRCQMRSAWFILTSDGDYLYMTPTAAGEHFNTTRRATWVTHIRGIAERNVTERHEIWDILQMPAIFAEIGLSHGRLGFELGDGMTLGICVNDFLLLRELMPRAQLVDGAPVIRHLMSVLTPLEINRLRRACEAGVWIHGQVPEVLSSGQTEREFLMLLAEHFRSRYADEYSYDMSGAWDVRNPASGDSNCFHAHVTTRVFKPGDLVFRGTSGASCRGYFADIDRMWYIGHPPDEVLRWYHITWECNRAMAEMVRPGNRCSDVFAAGARVERRYGVPERPAGRCGHGYRNTGGLSVHPDCHTVLEPGMVISVEPMFANEYGFFDLEDQYLVTDSGAEPLHATAPEELPVIPA